MPSAAVADTHALVFHAAGGKHLGNRAKAAFASAEQRRSIIYIPAAVIWECSILARIQRIDLGRATRSFFDDLFSNPAYQPVDLTAEQVLLADEMRPNADPFDALICAAARHLSLPLLTRDAEIEDSGLVRVIW
ncbi:MAG TPA: type II toxin-antitoxin system VapC family toxin [Candidatus Acidoferrales bacterium]|nr:type II toxin-antitoxin system VapC family toxin [Candidatus Acidoferrales bacterium]